MFVLVTLRFLSNLPNTLIASLLYFFHVSVVCFNMWLKLSIKYNVLLKSMYKSCPLFVLHVLTTKIELSMPVRSLNIDLSNAAICILSCSNAFLNPPRLTEFPGFPSLGNGRREGGGGGRGGGRRGRHNQLGTLITPAVLYGYTWSWIPVLQVSGS